MKSESRITPSRENCEYTSCYCEENVWKLIEFIRTERTAPLEELFAVFISNENRMVPLWKQKSGREGQPVIWDYHVVLLQVGVQALVYDLDSELSFPCSLQQYGAEALRSDHNINPDYHRKLRVVPAESFLRHFASDRSHMRNPDGSWKMPPPTYPPIHTADSHMNLDDFISMSPAVGWGRVFSLDHFLMTYLGNSSSLSLSSSSSSAAAASSQRHRSVIAASSQRHRSVIAASSQRHGASCCSLCKHKEIFHFPTSDCIISTVAMTTSICSISA